MTCRLTLGALAVVFGLSGAAALHAEPARFMMRADVDGRTVEGQPLVWSKAQIILMGRDGALYDLDPAAARNAQKSAPEFIPYTSAELSALLRAEFDRSYDVTVTPHFVVVHPRGPGSAWGERLEGLYRGFTRYVSVRGFEVKQPLAPLVAVVFRNGDEYRRYSQAAGYNVGPMTWGHYDPVTNRVFLFDVEPSEGGAADWSASAATAIHEATHQAAYNVGVHQRFAEQPRWAIEGLAMMFEAPGVWNAASLHDQAARINRERLDNFRGARPGRAADWLVRLVTSDTPFETEVLNAYAQAWTLTFYLCETRPQEYCAYLARMAARKPFGSYPAEERLADFTAAFGSDLPLLAAQVERFVDQLP